MRIRNILLLLIGAWVLYRLSPEERRVEWRGRFRELGRALTISVVLYWIWILVVRISRW